MAGRGDTTVIRLDEEGGPQVSASLPEGKLKKRKKLVRGSFIAFQWLVGFAFLLVFIDLLVEVGSWPIQRDDFTLPATDPGMGQRGSGVDFVFWDLKILFFFRILTIVFLIMRCMHPDWRFLVALTAVFCILTVGSEIVGVAGFGSIRGSYVCRDPKFCCVHATILGQDASTSCPNIETSPSMALVDPECPFLLQPCSPTVTESDLEVFWLCNWALAATVVLMILFLILFALTIMVGTGDYNKPYVPVPGLAPE